MADQRFVSTLLLGGSGLINFLPVVGILSKANLSKLYGLPLQSADPNLVLLMRHRAALFGIVGGLMLCATIDDSLRPLAHKVGFTSLLSYMGLAVLSLKELNDSLKRVFYVDVAAVFMLSVSMLLEPKND